MHRNIVRIKAISRLLLPLKEKVVFVGGATVSLYVTDPAAVAEVRPTDDVDVVIELASYAGYTELEERLRSIGFENDTMSGVYCRYKIQGITVDVMPTHPEAIGFSNKWYPEGFRHAIMHRLDEDSEVLIFSLPYFIASKWEAHKGRGQGNFRTSRDFEDIVYVFEHADNLAEQLAGANGTVRSYLKQELLPLLGNPDFEEGLYCHMERGYYGAEAGVILEKLRSGLVDGFPKEET